MDACSPCVLVGKKVYTGSMHWQSSVYCQCLGSVWLIAEFYLVDRFIVNARGASLAKTHGEHAFMLAINTNISLTINTLLSIFIWLLPQLFVLPSPACSLFYHLLLAHREWTPVLCSVLVLIYVVTMRCTAEDRYYLRCPKHTGRYYLVGTLPTMVGSRFVLIFFNFF